LDLEAWTGERSFETFFDPEYIDRHPDATLYQILSCGSLAAQLSARLPAREGRSGSAAIDQRDHIDPREYRSKPASFLLNHKWKELVATDGRLLDIELTLPDWLYSGVLNQALVLAIDPTFKISEFQRRRRGENGRPCARGQSGAAAQRPAARRADRKTLVCRLDSIQHVRLE